MHPTLEQSLFNAVLRVSKLLFRERSSVTLQFLQTPCEGVFLQFLNQAGQPWPINLNGSRPVNVRLTRKGQVPREVASQGGPSVDPVVYFASPWFGRMEFTVER